MDPSGVATVKSHAASYRFEDVITAMRKMWGGESLAEKDGECKRRFGGAKTYMAMPSAEDPDEDAVWANYVPGEDETQVDEPLDDLEQVFDGASVYVAYRTSRGFYPIKGGGKMGSQGFTEIGHKAMGCQSKGGTDGSAGSGTGSVCFVYSVFPEPKTKR